MSFCSLSSAEPLALYVHLRPRHSHFIASVFVSSTEHHLPPDISNGFCTLTTFMAVLKIFLFNLSVSNPVTCLHLFTIPVITNDN